MKKLIAGMAFAALLTAAAEQRALAFTDFGLRVGLGPAFGYTGNWMTDNRVGRTSMLNLYTGGGAQWATEAEYFRPGAGLRMGVEAVMGLHKNFAMVAGLNIQRYSSSTDVSVRETYWAWSGSAYYRDEDWSGTRTHALSQLNLEIPVGFQVRGAVAGGLQPYAEFGFAIVKPGTLHEEVAENTTGTDYNSSGAMTGTDRLTSNWETHLQMGTTLGFYGRAGATMWMGSGNVGLFCEMRATVASFSLVSAESSGTETWSWTPVSGGSGTWTRTSTVNATFEKKPVEAGPTTCSTTFVGSTSTTTCSDARGTDVTVDSGSIETYTETRKWLRPPPVSANSISLHLGAVFRF